MYKKVNDMKRSALKQLLGLFHIMYKLPKEIFLVAGRFSKLYQKSVLPVEVKNTKLHNTRKSFLLSGSIIYFGEIKKPNCGRGGVNQFYSPINVINL